MIFVQAFTPGEQKELNVAGTYEAVSVVALRQMDRLIAEWGTLLDMVCGPISTGGLGTIEKNVERFSRAINTLRKSGYPVFSQMPYEDKIWSIRNMSEEDIRAGAYDQNLLEDFYGPIFRSNKVQRKHFIPGWDSSRGAKWEHNLAKETGTEISYLGDNLMPI